MDRKPTMTESKRFGKPDGSLRGNRFKVKDTWFRTISINMTRTGTSVEVKNESTQICKWVAYSDLAKMDVQEFGMIQVDWGKRNA